MTTGNKNRVYLLGIGGIGMSALARWFSSEKYQVAGYDKTATDLTRQLEKEGIPVTYMDSTESIPDRFKNTPDSTLIIYTPAIPDDNQQYLFFRQNAFEIRKRSEILGLITREHFTIAVAGTHGKTTTSSMVAHILYSAGRKVMAFVGGILQNYNSNILFNRDGEGDTVVVVEADEYDRSFLQLKPDIAVITAADADHLDIYGTVENMQQAYREFINCTRTNGKLVIKKGLKSFLLPPDRDDLVVWEYNSGHSSIRPEKLRIEKEEIRFDYIHPEESIRNIPFCLPGHHNLENAVAAISACLEYGISGALIKQGLATYRGVKRRFEYILISPEVVFIDDYAHHPEEIRAFLESVKSVFPDKYLLTVFQPHLFTRTRDFAKEFADSLSVSDEIILLDIYPARENPIPGITSEVIIKHIEKKEKMLCSSAELLEVLDKKRFDVIVTVGAGDIDKLVEPIKNKLREKNEMAE